MIDTAAGSQPLVCSTSDSHINNFRKETESRKQAVSCRQVGSSHRAIHHDNQSSLVRYVILALMKDVCLQKLAYVVMSSTIIIISSS